MSMKPITVAELIAHLQTLPQQLPVAYRLHSEQILMELDDVSVEWLQEARPDGWVHDKRSDRPAVRYVVFLGN